MSIEPCRECGKPVSTEATACPHCGCPSPTEAAARAAEEAAEDAKAWEYVDKVRKQRKSEANVNSCGTGCAVVFLAVVVLMLIGMCSGGSSDGGNTVTDKRIDAHVICQDFVKDRLKAPKTADFPWYRAESVHKLTDGTYRVESYVDSENSFGAKLRSNYTCVVRPAGGEKWQLVSLDIQ